MNAIPEQTMTLDELYALWDRLREEAISESDRHEIDAVFARQVG
jgi:hypothetical protein